MLFVVRGVFEGEVVRPVHGGGVVELVLLHAFERLPLGVNLVLVATTAFVAAGTGTRAHPREDGVLQLDESRRVMPTGALHAFGDLCLFEDRCKHHELKPKLDVRWMPLGVIVRGRRRAFGARPLSPLTRGFGRCQRRKRVVGAILFRSDLFTNLLQPR